LYKLYKDEEEKKMKKKKDWNLRKNFKRISDFWRLQIQFMVI